jgi:hypothetical protein
MSTTFFMADIRRLAAMVGMTDEVELDQLRRGLTIELDDADWPPHVTGNDTPSIALNRSDLTRAVDAARTAA